MSQSVAKNLASLAAMGAAAGFAAFLATKFLEPAPLTAFLRDTWILQGVLVTAVVALIYKLQSDIAGLTGLNSLQRAQLDRLVRVKSLRLWMLFFLIALSALLPRTTDSLSVLGPDVQKGITASAVFLQLIGALLCLHLPGMWNELRQFITAMVAEKERKERQRKELERLG